MVCPMRVIAVSVIALVAAVGVYLTFFWKPGVEEEKKKPEDNMDEIDDAESDEEEEMKGGGSSSISSTDKLRKIVNDSSTMDLITGNVMFKQFSTGSLIAIGVAHVAGFFVFHHLYCVPAS